MGLFNRLISFRSPGLSTRKLGGIVLVLIGTLTGLPCPAGEIRLDPAEPKHVITDETTGGTEYQFESPGETLTVDDIRLTSRLLEWQSLEGPINFGFTNEPIWHHFELSHPAEESLRRHLEIGNPLLRKVRLVQVVDDEIVARFESGAELPHSRRTLEHRHFVFPLDLPAGRVSKIYLRIETGGSHRVPLTLWQPDAFRVHDAGEMLGLGALYGTLLLMAAFNVLLYAGLKRRLFLYLASALTALALLLTSLHGTAFQFLFPQWPVLQTRLLTFSAPLAALLFVLFSRHFMDLRDRWPRAWVVTRILAVAAGAGLVVIPFLSYELASRTGALLMAIVCLVLLGISIVLALRGERSARFFLLAWSILLLGTLGKVLNLSGIVSGPFMADYVMGIGAVVASLIFSLVLSEQFHRERRERIHALAKREQSERELLQAARRHSVTNLPIRGVLEHDLERVIEARQPDDPQLAMVLIHLRGFDDINRTLGHQNADRLLKTLVSRLEAEAAGMPEHVEIDRDAEQSSALAHIEGVTFGCAFRITKREHITPIMQRLSQSASRPVDLEGLELSLGTMIGCSFHPDDSADAATLLRHAFIAYGSADADVNHMAFYDHHDNLYNARRLTLMTELKQAIESDALSLVFQPQVRCDSGEVFGFEALLRWKHGRHAFVSPDEFIPMAERSGLMPPLTEWVLDKALAFQKELESAGGLGSMSVNISPINLRDSDFGDTVRQALKRHNVDPQRLVLEITETAAMQSPEHTLSTLRALNDELIQISIDDFGTGHSSLSYLRRLPVQEIKIDRSFIMEIDRNQDDLVIARTIINMCHDLGYRIVAEGVESESALKLLRQLDCDVVQGYFLARPMSGRRALEWIRQPADHNSKVSRR